MTEECETKTVQINPVGWIELPVTDLDRAEKFYAEFFGFTMARQTPKMGYEMSWFPMDEGYGAAGMLIKGEGYEPTKTGAVLYFAAPDSTVEKSLEKATAMGINILCPKTDIGEHGFFAWIEDSEGNRIALHSMEG